MTGIYSSADISLLITKPEKQGIVDEALKAI